ncbi:MAG: MFS transporter [Rhodospirillaceae bacterium]|nr:MFS transporter [Rhodospirillaceae bacterium]|tara:strand:- start:483 stop:2003 length:1521 start_codon:yes stop_codon:yes gene_type:complete
MLKPKIKTTVSPATNIENAALLVTLTLVTMLYAMTVTIANVSLPQIKGALSATTDEIALIITFNIIATAVATPMTGWLSTRFGRRQTLIWSVIGFTVSSFLCGTATSLEELVFYRFLQGACGAPLPPLCQAIVVDAYPKEKIGPANAIFGMGVVLGPIIAPIFGGYLSETYSWRWVFYMIVPCGLASLIGVLIFIRQHSSDKNTELDWTGFISLAVTIAAFQFMLDRGERLDWFDNWQISSCAIAAVIGIYIFISHSITTDRPFLNPRLLLKRNYTLGLIFVFIFGLLNFTPITLIPALLQTLRGYPDSIVGMILGIRGTGTLLGFTFMFMGGSKLDPRYTMCAGFFLQGLSGWYMAQFSINLTMFDVLWTTWLQGLGVGLIWVPLTIVTFSQLDSKETAEGSSIFHLVRNFGSSVFISISIAIMIRTGGMNYAQLSQSITPLNEALTFQDSLFAIWSIDGVERLAALSSEVTRQAIMIGYINAFYAFCMTAFAICPFLFLAKVRK